MYSRSYVNIFTWKKVLMQIHEFLTSLWHKVYAMVRYNHTMATISDSARRHRRFSVDVTGPQQLLQLWHLLEARGSMWLSSDDELFNFKDWKNLIKFILRLSSQIKWKALRITKKLFGTLLSICGRAEKEKVQFWSWTNSDEKVFCCWKSKEWQSFYLLTFRWKVILLLSGRAKKRQFS